MPASDSPSKQHVSTSTLTTNESLPQELHDQLIAALLNSGGIDEIKAVLLDELSRTGWVGNLTKYIQDLMRSGDAVKYDDIMAKIKEQMLAGQGAAAGSNGVNGVNGATGTNSDIGHRLPADGGIKVPESVLKAGAKATLKEIEKVADIDEDDKTSAHLAQSSTAATTSAPPAPPPRARTPVEQQIEKLEAEARAQVASGELVARPTRSQTKSLK